jgi:hypothetical protein
LVILHRLSFLPEDALDVLRVGSVLGSSFSVADLSLIMGRPVVGLMGPLRDAVGGGVLDRRESRFAFRHELIWEALYADLPKALRVGLHLQAARALASEGAAPIQVAEHLMRGASAGDSQAVPWLHAAARDVAPSAPAVAIELLERALSLECGPDATRDLLLADLAMCLVWSGRAPEAEKICREVLGRGLEVRTEAVFRMCLVQTLISRENTTEALEQAETAMESSTLSEGEQARFRSWAATCRMALGDQQGATTAAEMAKITAERLGDELTLSISLGILAAIKHFQGRFAEGIELANRAVALADGSVGKEAHRFPVSLFQGLLLVDLDELDRARTVIQGGRHLSEELGVRTALPALPGAGLCFGNRVVLRRGTGPDSTMSPQVPERRRARRPWPTTNFQARSPARLMASDRPPTRNSSPADAFSLRTSFSQRARSGTTRADGSPTLTKTMPSRQVMSSAATRVDQRPCSPAPAPRAMSACPARRRAGGAWR